MDSPGITMEKHLDRNPADARGVKPDELAPPPAAAPAGGRSPATARASSAGPKPKPVVAVADKPASSLEELFHRFCSFGAGANAKPEMDG